MVVMNAKRLFIIAGAAWGVVLGLAGGVYAAGIAAGFAWLFLFGDNPWPDWSEGAILGTAAVVGLAILAGSTALGWAAGQRYEQADPPRQARGSQAAAGLILLAVLVAAGGVWSMARQQASVERQRQEQVVSGRNLTEMQAATHQLAGIDIDWRGGGADGSATVHLDGHRAGAYRLEWQIRARAFKKALLAGEDRLDLAAGPASTTISIPTDALVDGYRAMLSHQNANIMVDEAFAFETRLIPILDPAEEAALPQGESRNLEQGWSTLIDKAEADFPVRFYLYGGELSWQAR